MEYYLGEILTFAFSKIPDGTLWCNGQLMTIQANQALYALLGVKWGGDGRTTFGSPNLTGRALRGLGQAKTNSGVVVGQYNWSIGTLLGTDTYVISEAQLPAHIHEAIFTPTSNEATPAYVLVSSNNGKLADPSGNYLAKTYDGGSRNNNLSYIAAADAGTLTNLAGVGGGTGGITGGRVAVGVSGSSAPLIVNGPDAGVNFCITTEGVFPSFS